MLDDIQIAGCQFKTHTELFIHSVGNLEFVETGLGEDSSVASEGFGEIHCLVLKGVNKSILFNFPNLMTVNAGNSM